MEEFAFTFLGVEVAGVSPGNRIPPFRRSRTRPTACSEKEFHCSQSLVTWFFGSCSRVFCWGLVCCSCSFGDGAGFCVVSCSGQIWASASGSDSTTKGEGVRRSSAVSHEVSEWLRSAEPFGISTLSFRSISDIAWTMTSPLEFKSRKVLPNSSRWRPCWDSSNFSGPEPPTSCSQNPDDDPLPREITSKLESWSWAFSEHWQACVGGFECGTESQDFTGACLRSEFGALEASRPAKSCFDGPQWGETVVGRQVLWTSWDSTRVKVCSRAVVELAESDSDTRAVTSTTCSQSSVVSSSLRTIERMMINNDYLHLSSVFCNIYIAKATFLTSI